MHNLAFVGELNFIGAYQFNPNFAFRTGYDLMWVTNLALAQNQITFSPSTPPMISSLHSLFFRGFPSAWNSPARGLPPFFSHAQRISALHFGLGKLGKMAFAVIPRSRGASAWTRGPAEVPLTFRTFRGKALAASGARVGFIAARLGAAHAAGLRTKQIPRADLGTTRSVKPVFSSP